MYHINEKPHKCYFYKKKPGDKGKNVYKAVDNKAVKKIKALKNASADNLDKLKGNGYEMKISGKLIEDFELGIQEFEFHLKVGLSILESNKNRIKTNYANYFNTEVSVLPSIRDLLRDFGILKDLCELFESILKADFNEVLDEFEEIDKLIGTYKENNRLIISDDEKESHKPKKIDKETISMRNTNFINISSQSLIKTDNQSVRW